MLSILLLLYAIGLITSVSGWNIALEVTTQAGGAFGGEPFLVQPVITVNNKKGELQSSFEGRVTVQIDTTIPSNVKYEPVWKEGEAVPTAASDTFVSEDVADGRAVFSGLGIDTTGEGYQLKFILYDEFGLIMGTIIGDEFNVDVGVKYQLGFVRQPEMAYGGSVFGSQPLLAIQDRGGNVVTDLSEGMVTVGLQNSPVGSTLRCTDDNGFNILVKNGLADFQGLFINEAGTHYSLHFTTDIVLDGQSEAASNEFSVGVGPPAEIVLIKDASGGSVFGGKAFASQPRVEIHDAGGNILVNDSFSAVKVSFYSNPSRGKLLPVSGTTVPLQEGVVQFHGLSIDKAGVGYRLTYEFLMYDEAELHETSILVHGSYFNVEIGPPHQLSILRHSSGGWAGNQPFPIQPRVALLDAGGNVVVGDSSSVVTAHLTHSLAHNSRVIIDTSNDAIPTVTEVVFAQNILEDERTLYGPGDVIQIDVIFSQEVTMFQAIEGGALPQIILNTISIGGSGAVYGDLVPPQEGSFSRTISFEYTVETGHSITELDYLSSSSLHANDYSIEDAFGRSVDLTLPETGSSSSLPASKVIGISDDQPIVETISANVPTGDYGAGDEVNFIVTFDREVAVAGYPELPLNVPRAAIYVDGSGTRSLRFNYKVEQGDGTVVRLDISESVGAELLFPTPDDSISLLTNAPGMSPIVIDPKVEGSSLASDQNISIDTTPPSVMSISPQDSTTPSGTYAVGDTLYFELSFDKPVDVDVGLELTLNTESGVARYVSGSGSDTLLLQYVVEEGDVTSNLDFSNLKSLVARNTEGGRLSAVGHVRRQSLDPTTAVNLEISHLPSMTDTHSIIIDGERPQMLDVHFAESDKGNTFARGDTLTILVQFSAPVVVNEASPPILELLVGANERWATYSAGSGSATLSFSYQVVVGDSSVPLDFQYRQICHQNRDCTGTTGLVVRLSATLELDADLNAGFSDQGIQIAESAESGVTIDTSMAPVTTVVSTTTTTVAGTYGVGEIVDIQVNFSDQVFLQGTMPSLLLNTGNVASYYAGKETDTLTFRLISTETDSTSKLDWALDPATDSAIICTDTCLIENANRVAVDLRFYDSIHGSAIVVPLQPEIALDPSTPQIISVNTDKMKSPYCHPLCTYTVGEEINIYVSFDRPVVVQGSNIHLEMDVGDGIKDDWAQYDPSMSTENKLGFVYTVGHGHSSNGASLNYICPDSICSLQLGGATQIKSAASIPTLDADLTLPPSSEYGLSGDESIPILIDTSGEPHVTDVTSVTPDGEFGPGDVIELQVQFSRTVVVSGEPFLTVDVGTPGAGIATYKSGSGSPTLRFDYVVGIGSVTLDLDYIDAHSLHLGFDGVESGSIKQASTNPSIDANLDLALPGSPGSLGSTSNIKLDSREPFINLISSPPGEYSTGDKIFISIHFSRPVVIDGMPSLVLKAGHMERIAAYDSQPNDETIQFSYTIQLGDSTESLDYWSDEELFPSSITSIRLNGGWIRLKSTNPVLDADLHINPIDGYLDGGKVVDVSEGVALFQDIKIGHRGNDFKIWFQSNVPSTGGALQVSETVKIDASIEYEVQGDLTNRDPGDNYGSAVSLSGDLLAVGAPGKRNPIPEIQVLTVYSEASVEEHEVQIITTSVNRAEAVISTQEFRTCANAGETIAGSFTLTYNVDGIYAFASPIEFDSDVSADQLQSVLEHELNLEGLIATSASVNPACESHNSWVWSVTFLDSSDGVGVLETNGDLLIGNGASISESVLTRNVDMLGGAFQLLNPFNSLISREIPHDAPASVVKDAIQEDLAISVLSVQVENMDSENEIAELGRRWVIIFSHHFADYGQDTNVPQLQALSDGLFGKDSHVWTQTVFEGRGTLSGSFALSFRRSDPSYFVSHDSSEEEIKSALESLDSINEVTVSNRRVFSNEVGKSGCTWTIAFNSVNKLSNYGWKANGWVLDPGGASSNGNMPTLKVTSRMIGWNAGYLVQSETGRGEEDTQAQWTIQQKGDDGFGAGAVDIFRHVRETWRKEATVLASDYNSNDSFGASVSITDEFLLVGAPSKEVDGLPEQQMMTCLGPASGGFFYVMFRGFKSSAIPYDATLIDVQKSMVGLYGGTENIHSTPRLLFTSGTEGWDGLSSGFCDGSKKSISIVLLTPDGGGISTLEHRSGDLEMLTVDTSNLTGARIEVVEQRAGTVSPMGNDLNKSQPTGKQSGSAYLFRTFQSCSYCEPEWTQIMKFTPMNGLDPPTDSAQFGWSTVFVPGADNSSNLAIIGSPGFENKGKVYIFDEDSFALLDVLTDKNWNHKGAEGGRFGSSIDADTDTILVGSPGYSQGKGAVYVFRRSEKGKTFLASQAIYGPGDLQDGDRFGHSIALAGNRAVICAPHKTTNSLHFSLLPHHPEQVGACYAYSRKDRSFAFKLEQELVPSNVLPGDRFGWSVDMTNDQIIVGQLEENRNKERSPRPVQVFKTFCEQPPCNNAADSSFRLGLADALRSTPLLSPSTSANQMRDAIESSLIFGSVSVSRSVLPDVDGGHTWTVTFDSYDPLFRDASSMPQLTCDTFITSSLSCQTHVEHDIPKRLRGKAHLFDFDESEKAWVEQSFLFSSAPQKQDLLATSVAIDGDVAVAGAPNRELLNVNSGAALIYDIKFLNLKFPDGPYSILEGDTLDINVERSSSDTHQVVSLRTMDPNSEIDFQHYIDELYSLRLLGTNTHEKTPVELLTGNRGFGRSQYYGSDERRSQFIRGMYDFQAKNDYETMEFKGLFKPGESTILTKFRATDDTILEYPDENTSIQFNMRGMFASQLGRLKTNIQIADNNDGISTEAGLEGNSHPYQVLERHSHEELARFGAATDLDRSAGLLIVGSDQTSGFDAHGHQLRNVGSASIYSLSGGRWDHIASISPPQGDMEANMNFGQSVAISNKPFGRNDTTILIGAPGVAAAYVYTLNSSTNSWALQAKLTANDATLSAEDGFGGAIALNGDMAFVGSSSMEQVYVFRRSHVAGAGFVRWDFYSTLRSNDFDFDVYGQGFSVKHMHHQGFGTALAVSRRTLLVGAPYADYGNRGNRDIRENIRTDGIHNQGLGKGKVYSFYSQPHVQIVSLQSDEKIAAGSFRLKLNNYQDVEEDVSGIIAHDSTSDLFKIAIEKMATVGEVDIEVSERTENNFYDRRWRISFLSNFADSFPTLIPLWHGHAGCEDCDKFKVSVLSTVEPFITVTTTHSHQSYHQDGEMQPLDVTSTDFFGASIALDGPQAIIGSMHSAAKTRTTWDFETGGLQGWSMTGTAFQYQPTYGDNSKHRAVYSGYGTAASQSTGEPQSSRLVGRYYIATYDRRSGSHDNYQVPNEDFSLGSIQGDGPTGTLTSDPFIIRGKTISFLIGGGCDHKTTYVELLVDGYPSLRATGKCAERMDRVHWDVTMFKNRAGQIRIVDKATGEWGHISIDDIVFSWTMGAGTCLGNNFGQCAEGGGALPKESDSEPEKQHYTGREESPMSGAAYMFLHECEVMDMDDTSPSNSNCAWVEQERLVASDKREGNLFGVSVDVDHEQGIAIVGSSNAPAYGYYGEPISVHPYTNSTMMELPLSENLEDMMKTGRTYSATGGNIRLIDYLITKGQVNVNQARKFTEEAGSVYVFLREPAKYGQRPFWRTTEHAKISPPDVTARDHFGISISLDDGIAVMGATGRTSHQDNEGAAFVYDMEWARVKFQQIEYAAREGQGIVKIFVERDLSWSTAKYSIGYSTSDLTAVGVDTNKFDSCLSVPSYDRDGCGDYEQSSGEVTFNPGEQHAYFTIRILDDQCNENNMEYVQLNLHQIGGSPLRGENYRAQLRIDDDDFPHQHLSMNCSGGIG